VDTPATDRAANRRRLAHTVRDTALLWAVAGLIALAFAGVRLLRTNAAAAWPTAPGVITASGIETVAVPGRQIRYVPAVAIAYTYDVAGQTFTGTAVGRDTTPVVEGTAEAGRLLAAYPAGAPVTVFVNPNDPAEAFLETAAPDGLFRPGLLLLGGAAVVGLLAAVLRVARLS
jgi:hypothetical protein